MSAHALPLRHILLALVVVSIWGANFVAVKIALRELPPLLLCAVRFVLTAVPLVFFLPRPALSWSQLIIYGLTMFTLQFGFMFMGLNLGMSAGLASLILQFQVIVTLTLAAIFLKERILPVQIVGALTAMAGFAIVAVHLGGDVTVAGLVCLVLAAFSWGFGNFYSRRLGRVNPLALVAWGGLMAPLPMGLASLALEGPALIVESFKQVGLATVLCVAYVVYASTHVAYSLWSWLLARHTASVIVPFTLLVPIFGMLSSAVFLGESLPGWKFQAAALVIAGLALNLFGQRLLSSAPRAAVAR